MKTVLQGLLVFVVTAMAVCVSGSSMGAGTGDSDAARTWQGAHVVIPVENPDQPGKYIAMNGAWHNIQFAIDKIKPNKTIPTVIYLHGCTGFHGDSAFRINFLGENGYAVIAPDSFARSYRIPNCNPISKTGGWFREAYRYRQEEIRYAINSVRKLIWVDQGNIFLYGHSEGGLAVARYSGDGFRGHIISGWTCKGKYWGIAAPSHVPVLAMVGSDDKWTGTSMVGDCGQYIKGRPNSRSLIIQGAGHSINSYPEARKAILKFLEINQTN